MNVTELVRMAPDGTNGQVIAPFTAGGFITSAAYSSTTKKYVLAYGGSSLADPPGLFTMNVDGTQLRRITTGVDESPDWSPDGSQIVLSRFSPPPAIGLPASMNVVIVRADGTSVRTLTQGDFDRQPRWSPDGQRIAFVRGTAIHTVRPDGSNLTQLVGPGINASGAVYDPAWLPDNSYLAFSENYGGGSRIRMVQPNGASWRVTTDKSGISYHTAAISPDGLYLAVVANLIFSDDVFVCRMPSCLGVVNITNNIDHQYFYPMVRWYVP